MIQGIKTSLLSIVCAMAATATFAAPTVRVVGGNGTYESAAAATAASRAGSLRTTGGYIRPTTSVSGSSSSGLTNATATTGTATTGGAVSTGGMTANRVASTPRLSIGKYIGAPKSVSSSGGGSSDLDSRVEKLEGEVTALETDKQDALTDSEYITIQGDQVVLNIELVKEELERGSDGREIELGTNDNALIWKYVDEGEDQWRELITWDEIGEKLDFGGVDEKIEEKITELKEELKEEIIQEITESGDFVLTQQDENDAGKILMIDDSGVVTPTEVDFATVDDIDNALDELGDLAYQDTVGKNQIDAGAVTRATLASEIANAVDGAIFWETWWKAHKDELASGDYVVAVSPGTNASNPPQLFRVITAEDEVSSPTPVTPVTPVIPDNPDDPDTDEP